MKWVFFCIILIFSLLFSSLAYADTKSDLPEPTPVSAPTPAPTFTPAPYGANVFNGLIGLNAMQNATNEDVLRVQIRLRDLGYFNFKPTGIYQSMTANAAKGFQLQNTMDDGTPMIADGTIGSQTMVILFRHNVSRVDIAASIPFGSSTVSANAVTGELVSWSEVRGLLTAGQTYTITDYNTTTTFLMTYLGGENHAEMECLDAVNAGIYKDVFGGEYNFSKRSVLITVGDRKIAASLQGWPHGEDSTAGNGMEGHACLYFEGSLSDVGSLPDAEHMELVHKAAGKSY